MIKYTNLKLLAIFSFVSISVMETCLADEGNLGKTSYSVTYTCPKTDSLTLSYSPAAPTPEDYNYTVEIKEPETAFDLVYSTPNNIIPPKSTVDPFTLPPWEIYTEEALKTLKAEITYGTSLRYIFCKYTKESVPDQKIILYMNSDSLEHVNFDTCHIAADKTSITCDYTGTPPASKSKG